MKQLLVLCAVMSGIVALHAGENMVRNGGFEKTSMIPTSGAFLQQRMAKGWEFGTGKEVELAGSWTINVGKAAYAIVSKAQDPTNVHSGEKALKLTTDSFAHLYMTGGKAGAYKLRFFAKGKGTLQFGGYFQIKDPETGKIRGVPTKLFLTQKLDTDSWTEFSQHVDTNKILKGTDFLFMLGVVKGTVFVDDVSMEKMEQ